MARKLSRRELAEEKRKQRNKIFMGVFIIVIMVASTFAFIISFFGSSEQAPFRYEIRDDQLFVRTSAGMIPFYNFPQGILIPSDVRSVLRSSEQVVFSANASSDDFSLVEIVRFDFSEFTSLQTRPGLLEENEAFSFPVVTCADATAQQPVLVFVEDTITSVSLASEYCIEVRALGIDIIFVRDALLYAYYNLQ